MGKTEKGAIWIDKDKISAYDFYQGIYQTPDACVKMMFALFTDLDMSEIEKLIGENIVEAKKRLCFEITKFVRGEEDAILAKNMSENLFADGGDDAPIVKIERAEISDGIGFLSVMVRAGLANSNGEARRLVQGGGVTAGGEKVTDPNLKLFESDFENGSLLLKKGKKSFVKIEII